MSLSVSMSGLGGRGAKGWSRWRELPAGGIRASQGTFSSSKTTLPQSALQCLFLQCT